MGPSFDVLFLGQINSHLKHIFALFLCCKLIENPQDTESLMCEPLDVGIIQVVILQIENWDLQGFAQDA